VVSRVDSIVAARDSAPNAVFALSRLGDERAVALQKAYALLNTADFSIGWFSLGYGAQGTSFMLIDTSATLVAQLKSTTNIAHTVRLQYSRYSTPAQGGAASYWTVGASTATTDNFVKLKKLDVTDIRQIGPTSGTREARSSVTAYQGAYEQGLASASVFADYYRFLTPQNTTALHLYPSVDVQRATVGVANFGLGLLSIFAKSSDAAARFNAELFITFTDLANALKSAYASRCRSHFSPWSNRCPLVRLLALPSRKHVPPVPRKAHRARPKGHRIVQAPRVYPAKRNHRFLQRRFGRASALRPSVRRTALCARKEISLAAHTQRASSLSLRA
jgi:hypothetical protein